MGSLLTQPLNPRSLSISKEGRLYHEFTNHKHAASLGGRALIKSHLALEMCESVIEFQGGMLRSSTCAFGFRIAPAASNSALAHPVLGAWCLVLGGGGVFVRGWVRITDDGSAVYVGDEHAHEGIRISMDNGGGAEASPWA